MVLFYVRALNKNLFNNALLAQLANKYSKENPLNLS